MSNPVKGSSVEQFIPLDRPDVQKWLEEQGIKTPTPPKVEPKIENNSGKIIPVSKSDIQSWLNKIDADDALTASNNVQLEISQVVGGQKPSVAVKNLGKLNRDAEVIKQLNTQIENTKAAIVLSSNFPEAKRLNNSLLAAAQTILKAFVGRAPNLDTDTEIRQYIQYQTSGMPIKLRSQDRQKLQKIYTELKKSGNNASIISNLKSMINDYKSDIASTYAPKTKYDYPPYNYAEDRRLEKRANCTGYMNTLQELLNKFDTPLPRQLP
jgi:hypothetical protein